MATASQLKVSWQKNPDALVSAFHRMLKEFGYDSLTEDEVRMSIAGFYDGTLRKSNVIAMMIAEYLENGT